MALDLNAQIGGARGCCAGLGRHPSPRERVQGLERGFGAGLAEFHKVKSSYYSKLLWDTTEIETPQKPEVRQLGSFDDQEGFNGFFPAPSFLKAAFLKIMEEYPVVRLDKLVKGVGGEVSQEPCHAL